MKAPQLTVVMPVYNAERFLKESISSILNQSFSDFEFLIINDGSIDKSLGIIKGFAEKDKRIKVISRANKGLIPTLNEGLAAANGRFIARQDADDISLPSRLKKQMAFLQRNPDTGLLGTNIEVIDDQGKIVPRDIANVDLLTKPDDLKLAEVFSNQFAHGSIIAKARLIKEAKYDSAYAHAEDYELWSRLSRKTKAANLKEPLYKWRLHKKSVTTSHSVEMTNQALRIAKREFNYYQTHKSDYRSFSFHPLSMKGGFKSYVLRKSSVYRNMALMYTWNGMRHRALPILVLAIFHAPWLGKNYRFFMTTLTNREKASALDYELY